jgi:hypothetical protein
LKPRGLEIVDVCLEIAGPEAARPWVEAAGSTHPSLIDQTHQMDARFGVTNIPQVIWIDESGTIVRPPEQAMPVAIGDDAIRIAVLLDDTERRQRYEADVRDWVENGARSQFALPPDEVIRRSQPRSRAGSEAAAHFELAQHLWRLEGMSERAIAHFNAAHDLQPDNITYKRQAYSALAVSRFGDDDVRTRFRQVPAEGEDWPFVSDFNKDIIRFEPELAARLRLRRTSDT